MRKYLLFTFTLFIISTHIFAQTGAYIKPHFGAGLSDFGGNPFGRTWANGERDIAMTGGVELGLASNRWHKSIGISILRIGSAGEIQYKQGNTLTLIQNYKVRFQHILMPLKLGYEFRINKVSLIPELGVTPAYTLSGTAKIKNLITNETITEPIANFERDYRRFSLFGLVGINFVYHINKHLSLSFAPSYYLMVSNNIKGGGFLNYGGSAHQYALTANAGVILKL